MRFSYQWLRELVDGLAHDPRELSQLVTMKTAESEGVEPYGEHFSSVVAARVVSAEPIPGTALQRAHIDAGPHGTHTVVCGAPNCRAGMVTAWVPPGTVLQGKAIGRAVLQGVESAGMLASGAELGLNREDEGILELQAEPGQPLPDCLPDAIIEIDNKSLTHRPDLWGHHGMAREVAAITGLPLREPVKIDLLPRGEGSVSVQIDDLTLCPRYSAVLFENVTVQPSPLWLQHRLEAVGLNPINNIVDLTNYVMAELAQPTHAFDADKLHGGIHVRRARQDETIQALNGEAYTLTPHELVIADEQEALAVAGIIGGASSAISEGTTRVLLESANFHAATIRRGSSRLHLRTDASVRFEKSQDPHNTTRALARIIELMPKVSPGARVTGGVAEQRATLPVPPVIHLPLPWLRRKLGKDVEKQEVRAILLALEFILEGESEDELVVRVPTWRATKDISSKDDLVEEVGRMIGYATITPTAPLIAATVPPQDEQRRFQNHLRQQAAELGFHEVYNYSFLSQDEVRRFGMAPEDHIAVKNPIAAGQELLRRSLLPGILRNVQENSKYADRFRLFEIGREIHPQTDGLPNEIPHLAAAVYGKDDGLAGLQEAKRLLQHLAPEARLLPTEPRPYEHPARTADVLLGETAIGRLFEFHPNLLEGRGAVLNLDVRLLYQLGRNATQYRPVRRTPASSFDLSVVTPSRTLAGTVEALIRQEAGPHLEELVFLRQYVGPPLPEDQKSLSFRLTLADPDRTISSEEAARTRDHVKVVLEQQGFALRG